MTEEEIAEINLAEAWVGENGFGSDCNNLNSVEANREMVTAFLAGLKADKPKFHKVADGKYPSKEQLGKSFIVAFGFNERKQEYYSFDCAEYIDKGKFCTHTNNDDKVIAWCEIPKYTEE